VCVVLVVFSPPFVYSVLKEQECSLAGELGEPSSCSVFGASRKGKLYVSMTSVTEEILSLLYI
jgi:hypothetical protein